MASKGRIKIVYRDPSVASFSASDIVMNVTTGTLFYKRNRELYSFKGADSLAELVVFPGNSTNYQILFNDTGGGTTSDGVMQGTDEFVFKPAGQTCGCLNKFEVGVETLSEFSGSVRIGTHLPASCSILHPYAHEALYTRGNVHVGYNDSASMQGAITASGNISTSGYIYQVIGQITASQGYGYITSSGASWEFENESGLNVGSQIYIVTGAYGQSAALTPDHQLYTITSIYSGSNIHSASISPDFDGLVGASNGVEFSGSVYTGLLEPSIYSHNAYINEYIYHQKNLGSNTPGQIGATLDAVTFP